MQFDVSFARDGPPASSAKPPKIYKVKVTKVAEINTEYVSCSYQNARNLNFLPEYFTALSMGNNLRTLLSLHHSWYV